jgi:hypothetical protein
VGRNEADPFDRLAMALASIKGMAGTTVEFVIRADVEKPA